MKYSAPNDKAETPAPRFPGGLGDQTTSVHLLAGILGALYDRSNTGKGQFVEATLYRAGIWTMGLPITTALQVKAISNGTKKTSAPEQLNFGTPSYNSYPCKGGRWMQLLGLDAERHLGGILAAIDPGNTVRSKDPFQGDIKTLCRTIATNSDARRQLILEMNELFRQRTVEEWLPILKEQDVWHHAVSDVNEVIDDAQANAVGAFTEIGAQYPIINHPIKWSEGMPAPRGRAPALGSDTEAVLSRLGFGGKARL